MNIRQTKIADSIRDVLARAFIEGAISDPRLKGVNVVSAKITADLQLASVYFRILDDTPVEDVQAGLHHSKGYLKKILTDQIEFRRTPNLRFFYDESIERVETIEGLIKKTKD